jgi:hypothetical protein
MMIKPSFIDINQIIQMSLPKKLCDSSSEEEDDDDNYISKSNWQRSAVYQTKMLHPTIDELK